MYAGWDLTALLTQIRLYHAFRIFKIRFIIQIDNVTKFMIW